MPDTAAVKIHGIKIGYISLDDQMRVAGLV